MTGTRPVYGPGDVVYGRDPFKQGERGRPWLVIHDHEDRPFHGEQYVALTLTTRTWHDGLLTVEDEEWVRGGTPAESSVVPWGVQSLNHGDVARWQSRLADRVVQEAVGALLDYLDRYGIRDSA